MESQFPLGKRARSAGKVGQTEMMALPGVSDDYLHYQKVAVPLDPVIASGVSLKFYALEKQSESVPAAIAAMARAKLIALAADSASGWLDGDCGFVMIHRCGADFHFLLPSIWRGSNELWEGVLYHHGNMTSFERFDPAYPPITPDGIAAIRPTFCVWELGIVAHEALIWGQFLSSERGEVDLARWQEDMFSGAV